MTVPRGRDIVLRAAGSFAIAGLTLGLLTRRAEFMSVSHGWFRIRIPKQLNGVPDALRFFKTLLLAWLTMHNNGIGDARTAH
ncbi:DUF2165 family protein [Burkholderia sp. LMG 32019]|uniref:DUF2165 family protein n=1 Tax=Burkholderia sp. LMG 32019 TaxID=3158173 RepID=UPI003C2AE9F1